MTALPAPAIDFEKYGDYEGPRVAPKPDAPARPRYRFQGRISADGSSSWQAESGRYHIYVSWSCPWAQRAAIVRKLKGLENVISLSAADPIRDGRGWAFRTGENSDVDHINGFRFLEEAYEETEPGYDGLVTVPVVWDKKTRKIVSNNFPDITVDLNSAFNEWAESDIDLYPEDLRKEIDERNDWLMKRINSAVYAAPFAEDESEKDRITNSIFDAFQELDELLASQKYLFGDALTESDVRLYVTLARFDIVHYELFKTNFKKLTDYPNLWRYARSLYQIPAFKETTFFEDIKRHYFMTQPDFNPSREVPEGLVIDWSLD